MPLSLLPQVFVTEDTSLPVLLRYRTRMPARSKARLKSQIVTSSSVVPSERVEQRILSMRGQNLMLDADLAELYGVATKALNQAVRRNIERFPQDFMFFEVTNCDLKQPRWTPLSPTGIH